MKKLIVGRIESGEAGRRNDILQFLIDTQQNADESLTANAIAQETVLFLIAGSETTSNSTGFAIIQLIKNPHVLKKLRDEIDTVPMNDDQKFFTHAQIHKLPYLNAVINETLRMDAIAANGLQRRADRDMVLGGRLFIPKGVSNPFSLSYQVSLCKDITFLCRQLFTAMSMAPILTLTIGQNLKSSIPSDG